MELVATVGLVDCVNPDDNEDVLAVELSIRTAVGTLDINSTLLLERAIIQLIKQLICITAA